MISVYTVILGNSFFVYVFMYTVQILKIGTLKIITMTVLKLDSLYFQYSNVIKSCRYNDKTVLIEELPDLGVHHFLRLICPSI